MVSKGRYKGTVWKVIEVVQVVTSEVRVASTGWTIAIERRMSTRVGDG